MINFVRISTSTVLDPEMGEFHYLYGLTSKGSVYSFDFVRGCWNALEMETDLERNNRLKDTVKHELELSRKLQDKKHHHHHSHGA